MLTDVNNEDAFVCDAFTHIKLLNLCSYICSAIWQTCSLPN